VRRVGAVALLAVAAVLATAGTASAHALYRSSSPPANALLKKAPSDVTITFTEQPDPKLSFIQVLSSSGTNVAKGAVQAVPGQPTELRTGLGSVPDGVYTVTWRTVSKEDGHTTAGSFSFGVGVTSAQFRHAPKASTGGGALPKPVAVAGRWLLYWGLALLFAAPIVGLVVFRSSLPLRRIVLPVSWAVAVAGFAMMVVAERSSIGVGFGTLFSSTSGHHLIREGAGLAAVTLAVPFAALRRDRAPLIVLGLAAAATMLLHAMNSHASAASPTWFNVGDQWLHLLSVATWVGGLVWLLLGTGTRADEQREPARAAARFSWLAGITLAVVAATGIVRALDEVGMPQHWRRLFDTNFGITLLVKVGLFALLVMLAARNRYVNVPGLDRGTRPTRTLRRTVLGEVILAAAVLGATGVLSELAPANAAGPSQGPSGPRAIVGTGHDFATTTRARLRVTPGTVGPNRFAASVVDYDTGRPVTATSVTLTFTLPGNPDVGSTLALHRAAGGTWVGSGTVLSIQGRWNVMMLVQEPTGGVEIPLHVETRLPQESITKVVTKGQPTIYTIKLPAGNTLQTYIDPGRPGNDTVHFTFFTGSGNELAITSASATETPPSGAASAVKLIRFDKGHFAANAKLSTGTWTFSIDATTSSGQTYSAYFRQRIG
jgi:copper transport protein